MAQTSGRKSTAKKKGAPARKAGKPSARKTAPAVKEVSFSDHFHVFAKTKAFKVIIALLIALAVFGLAVLISGNDFDRFYTVLGIIILVTAAVWVGAMIISIGKSQSKSEVE